jgi:hypothetical protein
MNFESTRQQSHYLYDKQRLHHLKRVARPVIGTLFIAAFATVVFKGAPIFGEPPRGVAAGAAAAETTWADVEQTNPADPTPVLVPTTELAPSGGDSQPLEPELMRLDRGSEHHG